MKQDGLNVMDWIHRDVLSGEMAALFYVCECGDDR